MKVRLAYGITALLALCGARLEAYPARFQGYAFDAYVAKSEGGRYREFVEKGRPTLKVRAGEEYSIVVHNPLPVRAAAAVSVDGLNTVDGKRTSPGKARKWMIEPHSSITITGWQTGSDTNRKFVFTQEEGAYAKWKEGREGKPYSRNLGVIGVAWFWNKAELHQALHPPKPFDDEQEYTKAEGDSHKKRMGAPAPSAPEAAGRAGTGMGQEQHHAVREVEFNGNAGMFSVKDVLKLYYEFAAEPAEPLPFINEKEEDGRFADDMHKK